MAAKKVISGMLMDENNTITFVEICEQYNISEKELIDLIEYGVVEPHADGTKHALFDYQSIARIQSALRLKGDLGINTPGIALALELLDKLERLERELNILQRHFEKP